MTRRILPIIGILLALLILSQTGCLKGTNKDAIRIGFRGKLETYSPVEITDENGWQVLEAVFRGLYRVNDKWEKEPVLIEEIPSLKNKAITLQGKNAAIIHFKLKPDLKWSDGSDLTARDILFTYQLSYSPVLKRYNRKWTSHVKTATSQDNYRVSFVILKTVPDFNLIPMPHNALEGPLATTNEDNYQQILTGKIIYNGPYKIVESGNRKVTLKKNPNYITQAQTDNVELHFYHRESDMITDLEKGKLEAVYNPDPESLKKLVKNDKLSVKTEVSATQRVLMINYKNPIMTNRDFRMIMASAINRKALSEHLYNSSLYASQSWLSPKHQAFKPVLSVIEDITPEKINELIDKSDLEKNNDGILLFREKPIKLNLMIKDNDVEAFEISKFVRESLEKQGIEINVVSYPQEIYQRYLRERVNYDLALVDLETNPTVTLTPIFASPNFNPDTRGLAADYTGFNFGGWRNYKDDELAAQMDATFDDDERISIIEEQQDLFLENMPMIPLVNRPEVIVHKTNIEGMKPRGFGAVTWNIEDWKKVK